jgi:TonB family protein
MGTQFNTKKTKKMKTKNPFRLTVNLKLLLLLPVVILILVAIVSCATKKKTTTTQTEVAPPPPPPAPPPPPQRPVTGQMEGDAYLTVDEMPIFPGGDAGLLKYVAENTRYPKEAKDKGTQGKVILRFKVNKDGTVSDVSVVKGADPSLDSESIRVVSSIPKFTPGKLNGVEVPVWYMLPITFALDGGNTQRQSRFIVTGTDTVYYETKDYPQYTGGTEALKKFKAENIKYPPELKKLGIEGIVSVRFNVEKNGSVSDVRIIMGASPTLDAEAIRVTKLMSPWQPGKEKGKPVKFLYMTGYEFLLTPRTIPVPEEGAPYVVVEEMPMFPGGDSALLAYIGKNTKYPEAAKVKGAEGRVIVRFCVTDVGGIDKVSVLRGVDPELDAEAIRVVKSLPTFKPGKQGGKPVNVWYMVPITYGLSKPTELSAQKTPPPPPLPAGYDEPPVYKGGEKAMYKFINSKLVYPKAAKDNLVSGKVNIRFSIDTDGAVGGVSVAKGVSPDLDAEAVRVVTLLPAWKPAKLEGNPVKVWYAIPVTFTLK